MEDPALSVFSEARNEYMKQLTQYLRQPFLNFFMEQLQVARDEMRETPKKYLWQFQNRLKSIKEWNVDKVQHEINRIQMTSNCDFLEELITAVFIAHTKVMTAIRISSRKSKVNITVPKLEHYLFKALCESSDLLWANAFLFRDDISPIEKQKNMRQVESIVIEGMQQAIRCLLPVKSILRDLVAEDEEETGAGEDVEEETGEMTEAKETESSDKEDVAIDANRKEDGAIDANIIETAPKVEEILPKVEENIESAVSSLEETRHIENKKDEVHGEVHIVKLPSEPLPVAPPTQEEVINVPNELVHQTQSISSFPAPSVVPEPALPEPALPEPALPEPLPAPTPIFSQEAPIFQVDTSKKVQFSEYNMGFKDEDEPDPYFETMDDGLIILDDKEENLGDDDFDSL